MDYRAAWRPIASLHVAGIALTGVVEHKCRHFMKRQSFNGLGQCRRLAQFRSLEKGDSHSSRDEPFAEAPRRKFRFALGDFGFSERVWELNRLGPPSFRIARILEFDRVPAMRRLHFPPPA